ncbi:MAG: two-component regulator propeller domain-containing protein, partial [Prevotella sp.]
LFKHDENDPMSLSSDNPYCTVEDKNGNIWIATYGGGVNILTKHSNGKYMFLNSKNVMRHYPYNSYNKVRTLTLDKEGNVWAGTTDGLLLMSYNNNRVRIQKISETRNAERDLNSKDIVCLACDSKGVIWIGTNGGGLSCTKGKDNGGNWEFETFDSRDGLPSEEIKSITFDQQGNVWFATDHMLCSFNTEKRILSTFSILDGVDDTICSEGAAILLPDGNIVFGTLDGFYYVDKKKLTNSSGSMLKLKITDFFIDGKLTSPRYSDSIPYYVPDSKSVELPSRKSGFAFRFASLNYQLQHRVHYQYMLEGYDNGWINAGKDRMAKYENIPAGTYRFKVKAFLLESPDAFDLRVIEVTVPPYFLLSSDAIWIYMFAVAVILLSFFYFKQKRLAQKWGKHGNNGPEYRTSDTSGKNTPEPETAKELKTDENSHQEEPGHAQLYEDVQTVEVEYIDETEDPADDSNSSQIVK